MTVSVDPRAWPWASIDSAALGLAGRRVRSFDVVGTLPDRPRLAIVGSRAAHRHVLRALGPIVAEAGARGWSILSGGALGIDGGAHQAALDHGVAQLAVLPCGRDRVYPPGHASLFAAMAGSDHAALLWAQPLGTTPVRGMFASRNTIVVGLADAVLVAEAGLRSGSLGTGRQALARAIPVAAIAGSPGCGVLIGAGARPLPEPSREAAPVPALAAAVGAWLAGISGAGADGAGADGADSGDGGDEPSAWPEPLTWLRAAIRDAGPHGLAIDALPDQGRAALAVCEAELLGLICEASGGRWVAVSS